MADTGIGRRSFIKGALAGAAGTACAAGASAALASEAPAEGQWWLPEKWDYETDVLVVGLGGAGVSAAIAAQRAGVEVMGVEAAPFELRGGNTAVCGGGFVEPVDVDQYAEVLYRFTLQTGDRKQCRDLAQALTGITDWMDELDIAYMDTGRTSFNFFPDAYYENYETMDNSMRGIGQIGIEHHALADENGYQRIGGQYFYAAFADIYDELGIPTLYETRGRELVQDPRTKEVLGLRAEDASGASVYIKARKGVLLTCGGFEANDEMSQNYIKPCMHVTQAGSPYNRGDGVAMSQAAGAKLWHMDCLEWNGLGIRCMPDDPVNGWVSTSTNWQKENSIIMVNRYGYRFYDESKRMGHTRTFPAVEFQGYADSGDTINDYGGVPAYAIFDQTRFDEGKGLFDGGGLGLAMGWFGQKGLYEWSEDNSKELASGIIKKGDTLEELAEALGFVGVEQLAETVERYNGFVDAGVDEDFGRDPATMVKIENGPFYGIEVYPNYLNTQGGPKHYASDGRVLDENDEWIPRLYAAGELGSGYGILYQGSGNTTEAVMVGKHAAEDCAALDSWE